MTSLFCAYLSANEMKSRSKTKAAIISNLIATDKRTAAAGFEPETEKIREKCKKV